MEKVEKIERQIFGEVLDDDVREAALTKNISDLRFYKWYLEHKGPDESWEVMLEAVPEYMNLMERRANAGEELDEIDQITLEGWKALRSGAFCLNEEASE